MKIYFFILLLTVMSCSNIDSKQKLHSENDISTLKDTLITDVNKLQKFSLSYRPGEMNLSNNKDINRFDLKYLLFDDINKNDSININIVNTILLKQYLYHLMQYNQGFDLLSMRKNQVKYLIDYYMKIHKIDSSIEMLNSGHSYQIVSGKRINNKQLQNLVDKINIEEKRISKE